MNTSIAFTTIQPLLLRPSTARTVCAPRRRPRPVPLRPRVMPFHRYARWSGSTDVDSGDITKPMIPSSQIWQRRAKLALVVVGGVIGVGALIRSGAIAWTLAQAEQFISRVGVVRGAAALFVLNFFTVLLCFPANMATMEASAAILGAPPAFAALYTSKLAAACVAFLLARGVLAPRVAGLLESHPRIASAFESAGAHSRATICVAYSS